VAIFDITNLYGKYKYWPLFAAIENLLAHHKILESLTIACTYGTKLYVMRSYTTTHSSSDADVSYQSQ